MPWSPHDSTSAQPSRRDFLQKSSTAVVGGALLAGMASPRSVHAGADETIKIGLIGCGGRGTSAATQALKADPNVKLTALGDAFADRLANSRKALQSEFGDKVDVADDHCFVGFDAYKQVIDSGVNVVLLATPPHFRPMHFKAAVAAGKHVFAEKPVAVDAPGYRSVLETVEEAKKKNLSVVSGLCWRYRLPTRELMKKVHEGEIGEIRAINSNYIGGPVGQAKINPEWSEMERQLRNWLYYTWLSGDHNVEQHVHSLDKAAWALQDASPVSAWGLGGRQVERGGPEYGNIFDHHSVVYEFSNGVKVFSYCRQIAGCHNDISDHIYGTKGTAHVTTFSHNIQGEKPWTGKDPETGLGSMFQQEHDELFASIRSGKPINNGHYMANSTMIAILGRMATYTGQLVTWEQAINSKENLSPAKYEWGLVERPEMARPGLTKLA